MGRALFLLIALLAFSGDAAAADPWTPGEVAAEAAYLGLTLEDWRQTRYVAKHDWRLGSTRQLTEQNPVLGPHPSVRRVDVLILAGALMHPVVAYLLPRKWRRAWIATGIVVETGCVFHNAKIGIRFHF